MFQWIKNLFYQIWSYSLNLLGIRSNKRLDNVHLYPEQIKEVSGEEAEKLFEFPYCVDNNPKLIADYQCNCLSKYTIIKDDELKKEIQRKIFSLGEFSSIESRALGCFMGMMIGDALGAPLEFSRVQYNTITLTDFSQKDQWEYPFNKFGLLPGQWTDDASMGLCLAESLYKYPEFNPIDLRVRFLNWWNFGYRNSFANDDLRHSVGLGGCIGSSFSEFTSNKSEYTIAGNKNTSGNGSIMRLAAVPITYHRDIDLALSIAEKQSKTTHQGEESAECCRLMSFYIILFLTSDNDNESFEERKNRVFNAARVHFSSPLYSINCLVRSEKEEGEKCELNPKDREWNWKDEDFKYCESRATAQPGYIGSYAMDGLAMALHCVWTTNSFEDALIKAINLRGDSDTVGSITGQIAGSLYGIENVPKNWIKAVQQFDNNGDAALTSMKLVHLLDE